MVFASLLLAALAQDPGAVPSPPQGAVELEEVVVTGAPGRTPLDPFAFFETLCFDGNRLGGQAVRPDDDVRWVTLDDRERDQLGVSDRAVSTHMLEAETVTLVLKIDERPEGSLMRNACTLTIAGAHDQDRLMSRMAGLFHGAGTRHHLQYQETYPTIPGWTQAAWAAIPERRTTDWRVFSPGRTSETGFVVVTEPSFYIRSRYVVGELKFTAAGEMPVSVISLTHLFRP